MSNDVFVYGTLTFDVVWERVVGGSYASELGTIRGWNRRRVAGAEYPGITAGEPSIDCTVDGVVRRAVSAEDLERLDRFEGTAYDRRRVTVELESGGSCEAQVYIFLRPDLLREPWDRNEFERIGLRSFLARYAGFSAGERTPS